ncbi:MAG: decarboxylase [Jatrophihabitans sp.]|nr:decarboxylase [Jatrophihabitans sp.]
MTVDDDEVSVLVPVVQFDALPMSAAAELLTPCCASSRWVHQVLLGRPYHSLRVLSAASDDVLADLAWSDVAEALAGHPRIGDRAEGAGREAGWSRTEQAGTQQAGDAVAAELRAGNIAYEQRFGHVFLICATGRSAEQMLAALQQRLGNPTAMERDVVRAELQAIVRLRLIKTFR